MTCCITGDNAKKLFGYDHDKYWPLVRKLQDEVCGLYQHGFTTVITGGAQGADQIAFWAVHEAKRSCRKLKNVVYQPFIGQDRIWRNTGLFSRNEYASMIRYADDIVTVTPDIDPDDKQQIVDALNRRDRAMIDASSLVFAITTDDWQNPKASGRTVECLHYAKSMEKQILILDPFSLKFRS